MEDLERHLHRFRSAHKQLHEDVPQVLDINFLFGNSLAILVSLEIQLLLVFNSPVSDHDYLLVIS